MARVQLIYCMSCFYYAFSYIGIVQHNVPFKKLAEECYMNIRHGTVEGQQMVVVARMAAVRADFYSQWTKCKNISLEP